VWEMVGDFLATGADDLFDCCCCGGFFVIGLRGADCVGAGVERLAVVDHFGAFWCATELASAAFC